MRRLGLDVDSQTLWDQTYALATKLQPVCVQLHEYLLSKELVLADETRWPLLGVRGRKTKNWFVWSLAADDAVLYKIQDGRSNDEGSELLRDFSGVVVTDGYGGRFEARCSAATITSARARSAAPRSRRSSTA